MMPSRMRALMWVTIIMKLYLIVIDHDVYDPGVCSIGLEIGDNLAIKGTALTCYMVC